MKKKTKRIIPFILVTVLSVSFVLTNYNKAREAKAAFVVDDLALMISLFAMCGVAYTGLEYYYANGQWLDDTDSPVADPETQKKVEDLLDRTRKHWDEEVRKKAIAQGLIDEDGNILNGGSGGSGGSDDDDNKFPTWEKLKEKVSKNGGNVALSVASLMPFVALYSYSALKDSGADLADKLIDDGLKIDMNYIKGNTVAYSYSKNTLLAPDGVYNIVFYSDSPICTYQNQWLCVREDASRSMAHFDKNGSFVKSFDNWSSMFGYVSSSFVSGVGEIWRFRTDGKLKSYYPNFDTLDDVATYFREKYQDTSKNPFNPVTIGQDSSLRDAMTGDSDYPTSPIHNFTKLPSIDKLKDFIKNLKNTSDDNDGRQKVVDDFINDLTNPDDSGGENPDPTPTPDPDNPDSGGGGSGTDNPDDTDKNAFTRDLRLVFPFCIPFDLIDCIRLFSAEPETPKIDIPMHFPIVDVDYTFTIDLKDFDGVAKICRSMFLILFIIGLVFATRPLIRG